MDAGYPWAPAAQQDDSEAASTATTSAAAPAPVATPLTSVTSTATLTGGVANSHDQSASHPVVATERGKGIPGMDRHRASSTAASEGLPEPAPRAIPDILRATKGGLSQLTPPSAGRGSEGGVSTSEPASVVAKQDMASAESPNTPTLMNTKCKAVASVFDQSTIYLAKHVWQKMSGEGMHAVVQKLCLLAIRLRPV